LSAGILTAADAGAKAEGKTAAAAEVEAGADAAAAEMRLRHDVEWLADDAREGRGVGTKGLNDAAEYIRQQFEEAGLDVTRVEGGAFQKFDMVTGAEAGETNTLTLTGADGKAIELKRGEDFEICSFGSAGTFSGEVVFAGYGIEDKESEYSDFEGLEVKDRIVLIIRRNPQQGNPHGAFAGPHGGISRHAELRTKVSNAYSRGAKAVLLVNDPFSSRKAVKDAAARLEKVKDQLAEAADAWQVDNFESPEAAEKLKEAFVSAVRRYRAAKKDAAAGPPDDLMKFGYGGKKSQTDIPVLHITQAAADKLLQPALKKSLEQLEAEIDKELKPGSAVLTGFQVAGEVSITRTRADIQNVIGVLEGSGPKAEETIVIGAHYDHVGRGGPDSGSLAKDSREVHNGADDNGSGTAALLELARRLAARAKEKPFQRRIVFIAFTAEELGLIGSARYVSEPLFPLDSTVAMFNMDMVGRLKDDKLTIFGTGTAPEWKALVEELAGKYAFDLTQKPSGFGPS
ncbi:MAG: M28 family peptidase, partial [Planctomycetaceae bacterium]|nr:M28 family peptidase [Planctomycetaceae bacterium]